MSISATWISVKIKHESSMNIDEWMLHWNADCRYLQNICPRHWWIYDFYRRPLPNILPWLHINKPLFSRTRCLQTTNEIKTSKSIEVINHKARQCQFPDNHRGNREKVNKIYSKSQNFLAVCKQIGVTIVILSCST